MTNEEQARAMLEGAAERDRAQQQVLRERLEALKGKPAAVLVKAGCEPGSAWISGVVNELRENDFTLEFMPGACLVFGFDELLGVESNEPPEPSPAQKQLDEAIEELRRTRLDLEGWLRWRLRCPQLRDSITARLDSIRRLTKRLDP